VQYSDIAIFKILYYNIYVKKKERDFLVGAENSSVVYHLQGIKRKPTSINFKKIKKVVDFQN
jgi:hypothetical protein